MCNCGAPVSKYNYLYAKVIASVPAWNLEQKKGNLIWPTVSEKLTKWAKILAKYYNLVKFFHFLREIGTTVFQRRVWPLSELQTVSQDKHLNIIFAWHSACQNDRFPFLKLIFRILHMEGGHFTHYKLHTTLYHKLLLHYWQDQIRFA